MPARVIAFADVEDVVEKGADAGRQGSRVGHVMLGHSDLHRRRHHHLRVQGECGLMRHVGDRGAVVAHFEMFEVLLDGAGRHHGGLDSAGGQHFPELLAGEISDQDALLSHWWSPLELLSRRRDSRNEMVVWLGK